MSRAATCRPILRRWRRKSSRHRHGVHRLLSVEGFEERILLATTLVSDADPSVPVEAGNARSFITQVDRAISADGRYVVFSSDANNLVPGDTNGRRDIFVRDLQASVITRVSTDSSGLASNGISTDASISSDGRYVVFRSLASNLVPGDTNGRYDIFIKDRTTGVTSRVSTDSSGGQADDSSDSPSISSDGRYVAFRSVASNLVPGDTNGWPDIFVKDRDTGVTTRVSSDSTGAQANSGSTNPSISSDGRHVVFDSGANNLVADSSSWSRTYVKNLDTGVIVSVSADSMANPADRGTHSPSISADGRYVVFASSASNLVPGDTNNRSDIFLRDVHEGITTRISTSSSGMEANGNSSFPSISADARFVAFSSFASDLVIGDSNNQEDIFVKDLATGVLTRVSTDSAGAESNGRSLIPSISADGRYVAFDSQASDLSLIDLNSHNDIFVKNLDNGETIHISKADPIESGQSGNGSSLLTGVDRAISADGRFVAFHSTAANLVSGDTNNASDIFVKDLATGVVTRVSTDSSGTEANGFSFASSISGDGRFVAFFSDADNLVPDDTNGLSDLFVKDLTTGATTRISTGSSNNQSNGRSFDPSISGDGRYVAFSSDATNLVPDDTNGQRDIFVKNLQSGEIVRVNVDSFSVQANDRSSNPSISADGHFVTFSSSASNLVPGDTNDDTDTFIKNLTTGALTRVSTDSSGSEANGDSFGASISANGRFVAFFSSASNLVLGDTNGQRDIFVKDLATSETTRVSTDSDGDQSNGRSSNPSISADGRHVTFSSNATNLVLGDSNGHEDVFSKDLLTGVTTRLSTDSSGAQSNGLSTNPTISADGRFVAFSSFATNLVPHDLNGHWDVYLVELVGNTPPIADIGGPYAGAEGDILFLDASASTDPEQPSGTLTYDWDLDNDGLFDDATGVTTNIALPDGPANLPIAIRVTDDAGNTDISSATISVANVAPTAAIDSVSTPRLEGIEINVTASATDPAGANDTLTYEYEVFKDGGATPFASGSGVDLTSFSFVPDDNGQYEIVLTVSDEDGDSSSDTLTVTVENVAPTVEAGSDQSANEGAVVSLDPATFNDLGTADTHTATIDWGDGSAVDAGSVTEAPFGPPGSTSGADGTVAGSHVYADNGTYTVTVTVIDDEGAFSIDTLTVTVENVAPTVDAGSDQSADEGAVVSLDPATFNDLGTADTHTATIDWGDGSAVDAGSVTEAPFGPPGPTSGADGTVAGSHVYADNGTYTVTVTVTDDEGASSSDTLFVTVENVAPTVEAGSDQSADEGAVVSLDPSTFNDLGTADTHTATIDWGDGSAVDAGTVAESPFGPPGSTSGADGTVSASHVYADNGTYTVTVTVTDDEGASSSDTLTVTVENVAPTVDAGSNQSADEGAVVSLDPATFNDLGTADTHTATIDWGDGSAVDAGAVAESPFGPPGSTSGADGTVSGSHVYADNGTYTVIVTVTDDEGASSSDTLTVTVENVAPTVDAGSNQSADEGAMVSLDPATFNDLGTADTHTATIDWGDGSAVDAGAVAESPFGPPGSTSGADGTVSGSHVYADNGTYTVTVTVTDDEGASSSDTLMVTVQNVAPTVDAGSDQSANEGAVVSLDPASFNDLGTADTHTATIDWGDGNAFAAGAVAETPFGPPGSTSGAAGTVSGSHVYADNGTYTVTVTVTDDEGASSSDTLTMTVANVAPTLDAGSDQTVTVGRTVSLDPATFNDLGTLDTHTATIDWGDSSPADAGTVAETPFGPPGSTSGAGGTVSGSHVYAEDGFYTISVEVCDDDTGCSSDSLQLTLDTTAPVTTATLMGTAGLNSWWVSDVLVTLSAEDNLTGVAVTQYQVDGGGFQTYTDPFTITGDSVHSLEFFSTDNVGNVEATHSETVMIDTTPPEITIITPPDGGTAENPDYLLNQPVAANYSCSDVTSGPDTCDGTVPDGSNIDTGTTGLHEFDVMATDQAGHSASLTHTYFVGYDVEDCFLPPLQKDDFATGRTIPVKCRLTDANGETISDLGAIVSIQYDPVDPDGPPQDVNPTGGTELRFTGNHHHVNWDTRGLEEGEYTLIANLAGGQQVTKDLRLLDVKGNKKLVDDEQANNEQPGRLLAGDLYVDVTGDLSAAQLARVQDAMDEINENVEPYGARVLIVGPDQQSWASLAVHTSDTSPCGGLEEGVLGCTVDATEVILITGWAWFTDLDTGLIDSGQFDYQTIMTHELAHALGMGHSPNANSVMYGMLQSGMARRELTLDDLVLAGHVEENGGPEALMAHVVQPSVPTSSAIHDRALASLLADRQASGDTALGRVGQLPGVHPPHALFSQADASAPPAAEPARRPHLLPTRLENRQWTEVTSADDLSQLEEESWHALPMMAGTFREDAVDAIFAELNEGIEVGI